MSRTYSPTLLDQAVDAEEDLGLIIAAPDQVGVELESSVHCSVIIACAYADKWGGCANYFAAFKSVVLLLISFAMQGILVWMCFLFSGDPIAGKLAEFCFVGHKDKEWNSPWGNTTKETRLTAACEGTDWSFAEDSISKMKDFFPSGHGAHGGLAFGLLALMLWSATIFQEIAAIVNYSGLAKLPDPDDESLEDPATGEVQQNEFVKGYGQDTGLTQLDKATGQLVVKETGQLVCLSLWIKALVCLITILRIVVAVLLLYVGIRFLSYTTDLKDFVLNSIALGFVLTIDEIVFLVLVPRNIRRRTTALDEPQIQSRDFAGLFKFFVGNSDVISFIGIILVTSVAGYFWLHKFQNRYRLALCALGCDQTMCIAHGLAMSNEDMCNELVNATIR